LLPTEAREKPGRTLDIAKPEKGFDHPWQYLPCDVFEFVHAHFSHFGCYEERVNWRWQYYCVDLYDGERAVISEGESAPWIERGEQLQITKASLNWSLINAIVNGDMSALSVVGVDVWARVVDTITRA